jgi:hypothetical protein
LAVHFTNAQFLDWAPFKPSSQRKLSLAVDSGGGMHDSCSLAWLLTYSHASCMQTDVLTCMQAYVHVGYTYNCTYDNVMNLQQWEWGGGEQWKIGYWGGGREGTMPYDWIPEGGHTWNFKIQIFWRIWSCIRHNYGINRIKYKSSDAVMKNKQIEDRTHHHTKIQMLL